MVFWFLTAHIKSRVFDIVQKELQVLFRILENVQGKKMGKKKVLQQRLINGGVFSILETIIKYYLKIGTCKCKIPCLSSDGNYLSFQGCYKHLQ